MLAEDPQDTFLRYSLALELEKEGEHDRSLAGLGSLMADDPPYAAVYYNTACFEARAGRIDAALAHLRRAVELSPSSADLARGDDDLAALRGQPGFAEIVGG